MLSNNVWSINEERAKRQKRTRKGVRSRGHFARLIQPREIRKNFNFCSDSLALSRKPLRIILYPPPPPPPSPPFPLLRSLSLSVSFSFPLFLKDIFNKESRLRSRLIRWFSRETDTYSIGRLWRSLFDTPSYFFPSFFSHNSFYPLHAAVGTFTVYPPPSSTHSSIFSKEREGEKPAAALPTGKRRGSRFKSRIFRGRKAARLLKENKKKNAPLAILFLFRGEMKKLSSSPRWRDGDGDAFVKERERQSLNHSSSRSRETHLSAKLRRGNLGIYLASRHLRL